MNTDTVNLLNTFSTFGFSAVMCFVIFNQYTILNKQHLEETKSFTDAINNLKVAINELIVKIESYKKDVDKEKEYSK